MQTTSAYQENLLCDTLDRMRRNPEGRKVVHMHISKLLPANRTPVKSKIVSRMFGNLESGMHVQIFPMVNKDLVMTVNAGSQRDVNAICNRIRTLFDDDPVTYTEDDQGNDQFVVWYDLEVDSALALGMAQDLKASAGETLRRPPPSVGLPSMTPAQLDYVQKQLASTNIIPFVKDQVAMRINPGAADAAIEFFEFFLSVGDLQNAIMPDINIFADRWLFQDLSRTMDLRMLETVVRAPHARQCETLSLNLNLETVATIAFEKFLERSPENQKLIVEVQAIDVLANIRSYFDVHDVISGMGHSLLIDGLTPTMLQMLDVGRLEPDYAKIMWAPEFTDLLNPDSNKTAGKMIDEVGPEKIVLARCDSQDAMAWGLKSGIRIFQGYFLDSFGKPKGGGGAGRAATR